MVWEMPLSSWMPRANLVNENSGSEERNGTCPVCTGTRRMVSATVASSIKEVVNHVSHDDLRAAERHAAALLALLREVPNSTSELLGKTQFSALEDALATGLSEIKSCEGPSAALTFRSALTRWYETYPPHLV
jgi:hypothetical protein